MDYPKRKKIWSTLPEPSKKNFIEATAKECLTMLANKTCTFSEIEKELTNELPKIGTAPTSYPE